VLTVALREDQILRYSRQILLPEVGGRGQERLLGHTFRLVGQGAAQETAVAYLAAAGCRVVWADGRGEEAGLRPVAATEAGFLLAAAAAGRPLGAALAPALHALNPDAVRPGAADEPDPGELGEVPARFLGQGVRVALGALGPEGAGVAWAAADACSDCFTLAAGALTGGLTGPLTVVAGSIAALLAQRVLLGLTPGVGLLRLEPEGGLTPGERVRCLRCG
jgi:molybdopterin-synthase adenylyltransferase